MKYYRRPPVFFLPFNAATFTALVLLACALFVHCSSGTAPSPAKDTTAIKATQTGLASYYGPGFEGKETASGETFRSREMTAAHPSYPTGTLARVTNLENDSMVYVRITDRGPTDENVAEGVIIDLSKGAAKKLGMVKDGRVPIKIEVLRWGTNEYKSEDSL
jgi:rare lipoprotein A